MNTHRSVPAPSQPHADSRFVWPVSHYASPIFLHRRTSEDVITKALALLTDVHYYTISTDSTSPSGPCVLQVQALHYAYFSQVFVLDVTQLPPSTSSWFATIRRVTSHIFSSPHHILAWGDVRSILEPFQHLGLFDMSRVTRTLDLQRFFTNHWNCEHPHAPDCIARHQPLDPEPISDDYLIVSIITDDLDDDYDHTDPAGDHNSCVCSDIDRPYKFRGAQWPLDQAVRQGLQLTLPLAPHDEHALCQSAKGDSTMFIFTELFATSFLYFHLTKSQTPAVPNIFTDSAAITPVLTPCAPLFLVLADSHGKCLPPLTLTPQYKILIRAVSGLQWTCARDRSLCVQSLIRSASLTSLMSIARGLLVWVGSNSIRYLSASEVLSQVEETVSTIHTLHPQLRSPLALTVANIIPCRKVSTRFPTLALLQANIDTYNQHLPSLASRVRFSSFALPVSETQLHHDRLHVSPSYQPTLASLVLHHLSQVPLHVSNGPQASRRSRASLTRRNRIRHLKSKPKNSPHLVHRRIHTAWTLSDVKCFLRSRSIRFTRLLNVHHHRLPIQLADDCQRASVDTLLPHDVFDENHHTQWLLTKSTA